jgi:hypothetical protein
VSLLRSLPLGSLCTGNTKAGGLIPSSLLEASLGRPPPLVIRNDWIKMEEFENFMIDPNYLARRRNLPNTFSLNFPSTGSAPWPALRGPRSIAEFFNDEFGDDSVFSTQASEKQGHTRCIANILDDHSLSTAVSVGTLERCPTPTHIGEEASEGTNGDRYEVRNVKQQSILHRLLVVQFPLLTNL